MSDYLGNLAARSLEPAQAVRPRLASRFEPVPSVLSPFQAAPEPAAFFETAMEETAVAPAPTRPSRSVMTPERTAPPEPVEEPPAAPRRRRARRDSVAEEEVEPTPERNRLEPVSTAVAAPVPVARVPFQGAVAGRGGQPSEASPPGPLSTGVERGNVVRSEVAHPALPELRTALQPPPRQEASASSPLSTPAERGGGEDSRANRPGDRELPESKPASTILQPKVTVIERTPPPAHREAPAPTIQVTIGRIEVRATPAAKAPVRERPAAPPSTLSLEEYLRQRSKGGRG